MAGKSHVAMELELRSPWSQLVSVEGDGEVVPIIGDGLSIGRKKGWSIDGVVLEHRVMFLNFRFGRSCDSRQQTRVRMPLHGA